MQLRLLQPFRRLSFAPTHRPAVSPHSSLTKSVLANSKASSSSGDGPDAMPVFGIARKSIDDAKDPTVYSMPTLEPQDEVVNLADRYTELLAKHGGRLLPVPGIRLLILVTDIARERAFRNVHRNTWMSRPGVCGVENETEAMPPHCAVAVLFAVGYDERTNADVRQEQRKHGDLIVLHDVRDPYGCTNQTVPAAMSPSWWRKGHPGEDWVKCIEGSLKAQKEKTYAAFRFAAYNLKWATHIAKNDLDNFPVLDVILDHIAHPGQLPSLPPPGWSEGNGGIYYGQGSRADANFVGSNRQGQLYVLSRGLLECVYHTLWTPAEHTTNKAKDFHSGHMPCFGKTGEDGMMGCGVETAIKVKGGSCPNPWYVSVDLHKLPWYRCKPNRPRCDGH